MWDFVGYDKDCEIWFNRDVEILKGFEQNCGLIRFVI